MTKEKRLDIQFILAVSMAVFGCTLLVIACFLPPQGVIDNSILIAVGEVLTFVASVFGLDYNYKIQIERLINKKNEIDNK